MSDRTTTLERFLAAAEAAIRQDAYGESSMTDEGASAALRDIRETIPVAKAIALLGNPLDCDAPPLTRFLTTRHDAVKAEPAQDSDPGRECELVAVSERTIYTTALVLGLILADQV